ncbi:tyrosine-type recombinase/integrase [Fredinandcohnia sp. QZ13]|uniref:tyrosine-type recombinase/integrase n=1 Tax=Fredinandcohnia sp. QZ13 TaxID=3073144 RepID=UPI00285339B5|nr:tyrosine-type recombinase/integrase [Fredinandcohnia sp. QZ13]MDR4886317.1 tyrosine-type recombinase/integrase [Fredinandcohnia sp. QZ13]
MAHYSEEWDFDCLDEELELLMEKHGFIEFHRALKRMELLTEAEQKKVRKNVTLSEAITYYFNSDDFNRLKESSQDVYRYEMDLYWKYSKKKLGKEPTLKEASSALFLQKYLDPVKKPATRSKKSAFLRSFLKVTYAEFFDQKIDSLKSTLSVKVDKNHLPRAFTEEQIEEIIDLSRLGREPLRNFTILWVFLGTGIRLNELCLLQIGDVKPQLQELLVCAKGSKEFKVKRKITTFSLEILLKYIKFRYSPLQNLNDYNERYIFSDDKGITPLHDSTVQKMLGNIMKEARTISEDDKRTYQLSVHSLRHSFALFLLQSGVNIHTIKDLLGHEWISSTNVYLKLFDNILVNAINQHPLGNLNPNNFF